MRDSDDVAWRTNPSKLSGIKAVGRRMVPCTLGLDGAGSARYGVGTEFGRWQRGVSLSRLRQAVELADAEPADWHRRVTLPFVDRPVVHVVGHRSHPRCATALPSQLRCLCVPELADRRNDEHRTRQLPHESTCGGPPMRWCRRPPWTGDDDDGVVPAVEVRQQGGTEVKGSKLDVVRSGWSRSGCRRLGGSNGATNRGG